MTKDTHAGKALRILGAAKRQLKEKNVAAVAVKLLEFWKEQHERVKETADRDLMTSTACRIRYEHEGVFFCAKNAPRSVGLKTLKICAACKAARAAKEAPVVIAKPQTRAAVAYNKMAKKHVEREANRSLLQEAQKLHDGTHKQFCPKAKPPAAFPLLELPCVKFADSPTKKIDCANVDCEERIKSLVRVLMKRKGVR